MVDFAQARRMMVDSQLRTFDVNDIPLLDAVDAVPRERFVLPGREQTAYIDQDVPVSGGKNPRCMLSPMILARMIQSLDLERGMSVLDVACGRGYSSAVLAELGTNVTALESEETLATEARNILNSLSVTSVTVMAGPLDRGASERGPYDAILVNGAVEVRPDMLLDQLSDGGKLVCIKGQGRSARATLYVRTGSAFGTRTLFDAAAPILGAFEAKPGFVF